MKLTGWPLPQSSHNRDKKISFSEQNPEWMRALELATLCKPAFSNSLLPWHRACNIAAHSTMFGSEYNWLIALTRLANGTLRIRLAGGGLVTLAIALCCLLAVALHAL